MRRRPIILLLCATAALVGAAIAVADAPGTGIAVKALGESPDAQVGPAVAVNPAGGSPSVSAAVVGTDWRSGASAPQSAFATGSILAASGDPSWAAQAMLPHAGQDVSHGSPDVVWGPGNKVYAVEVARDLDNTANPCLAGAGIYLFVSSNGGASWTSEVEIASNGPHQSNTDPSIAFDPGTGRIYVAYTKTDPCTAAPGDSGATSQVRLVTLFRDDAVGGTPITGPSGPSAQTQSRPSVTVLPGGGVGIAYYDSSPNTGAVLFATCSLAPGSHAVPSCGSPVTVDGSAAEPSSSALPGVHVRPRAASDTSGRVVVTWSRMSDTTSMDVFSATSRDQGASFGAPQLVAGGTAGSNQINPAIAIDQTTGRADIAYLDSSFNAAGFEVAATASNRPAGSGTSESWSAGVPVETTPIVPVAPYSSAQPSIGDRLGVAEVTRASGPPWTLIAWTDTRSATGGTPRNADAYSTVLLHGTTAPVGIDSTTDVQHGMTVPVPISATDADADPLTYSIAQDGSLGHATVPDGNKPQLMYAGSALGTDHVKVAISDGTFQTTATVTLNVLNTPPSIACPPLTTQVDTPLPITVAACVTDVNNDAVTLDSTGAQHGQIAHRGSDLIFTPDTGYAGAAQVTLTASDGIDTTTQTVSITVGSPGETPVHIAGAATRVAYTDRPITLQASPAVSGADPSKITWSINDAKPTDQGPTVAHLFTKVGVYTVYARVGNGTPGEVKVFVQKPPIVLKSTSLSNGTMRLRVAVSDRGKLTVTLLGVHGASHKPITLAHGTHTIRMTLPASVRTRGTVIVKLKIKLASGVSATVKRAVLLHLV